MIERKEAPAGEKESSRKDNPAGTRCAPEQACGQKERPQTIFPFTPLPSSLLSSMQQERLCKQIPDGKSKRPLLSSMQQEQPCKQRPDGKSKRPLLSFMQQEQPNGKPMTNVLIPTLLSSMQQEQRARFGNEAYRFFSFIHTTRASVNP
ncbi:hypothetical protein HMPREF1981_02897 [Bacteroides pyogenes F0041]|uniref:Uncharacterized protein n=1 Tax=Bacteroides pyogenes F0041 TaxID=1321819 RepID=U2DPV1_9BACE|nr:hypothetical protein [Bacteroides pyogenes]ERI81711.1 hypothetical protein HMPREF1981_02897 [Bacteroides pyogenes F0041]